MGAGLTAQLPAPLAGVISTSRKKGRGTRAGTGKPSLLPAPPPALPAALCTLCVHPGGTKVAEEPSPICPVPPPVHGPPSLTLHPSIPGNGLPDATGRCSQGCRTRTHSCNPGTTGGAGRARYEGSSSSQGEETQPSPKTLCSSSSTQGAFLFISQAGLTTLLCITFPPPPGLPPKHEDNKKLPPHSAGSRSCKRRRAHRTKSPL